MIWMPIGRLRSPPKPAGTANAGQPDIETRSTAFIHSWYVSIFWPAIGIVKLSERRAEEGRFSERWGQAVAPVLEISRQAAKARSREARRKSAGADWG